MGRKKAAKAAALAELEHLTTIARVTRQLELTVAKGRLAKATAGGMSGEEMAERDYIATVLMKGTSKLAKDGAMARLAELDGESAAQDEKARLAKRAGRLL